MKIGNRIIFDQDGEIVYQTGEMQGGVLPRKEITELHHIDIDFGAIDYTKYRIVKIDIATKQPILEEIPRQLTPEQQRIQELENQLLLDSGVI
ncbi:hypothetical protein [Anoxybacillus flavithermus]|uniref:Phage protein n=1 Tax=Anoxybacillus flavithermus TaxID=33934 RepID=A0A178TEK0_9BACL|nr:hypothetical protein [Anoxybacillus flavithermus]OAO79813.1 hypothetical protein TAF16_1324 [Anoxybacillus flavithermus]